MTEPWLFADRPAVPAAGSVTVTEGTTFCIGDRLGDLGGADPGGLFVRDTRVLSTWDLTVDGQRPASLVVRHEAPFAALHVAHLRPSPAGPPDGAGELLVTRHRAVGDGMREEVTVLNCSGHPCSVTVHLSVATDLADLFEVKDGRAAGVALPARTMQRNHLRIDGVPDRGYGVVVVPDDRAVATPEGFTWAVDLEAHGSWTAALVVVVRAGGVVLEPHHPRDVPVHDTAPHRRRLDWWATVPTLETPDRRTRAVLRTSIEDLGTLRIFDPEHPGEPVVAAGAPWFMALFGRDALISSLMLLPVAPELALGTCRVLAGHQGSAHRAKTEEEPGRILHELRLGPAGTLALGGGQAYYGTVDATPLFVMTVGQVLRWSGPDAVTPELMGAVDRALDWITGPGDADGDGFVEYARKTPQGLRNQGWKDSWDGVNFGDGRLADAPIALAEVQGYVYAAFHARADLAEVFEDGHAARTWRERAGHLKRRFDEAFWLPERGWYAAALDHAKEPVDALTSALGHLLWTGIVAPGRVDPVVGHLLSPEMFSGWGIRTLATSMGRYDPLSYHNGSVWPHDTAICVAGLARYGRSTEAAAVAEGLLDAARCFDHRLPELFAGFDRNLTGVAVPYPAACAPQAWAAAAPVEVLRALLGLTPDAQGPTCEPIVPDALLPLRLDGLRCRDASYAIEVTSDGRHRVRRSG